MYTLYLLKLLPVIVFQFQFLCEAVGISLGSAGPKTVSMISSAALKQHTSATIPNIEVSEIEDFIFLLAELWELDIDNIKRHWVLNLFACGHGDHGREVHIKVLFMTLQFIP